MKPLIYHIICSRVRSFLLKMGSHTYHLSRTCAQRVRHSRRHRDQHQQAEYDLKVTSVFARRQVKHPAITSRRRWRLLGQMLLSRTKPTATLHQMKKLLLSRINLIITFSARLQANIHRTITRATTRHLARQTNLKGGCSVNQDIASDTTRNVTYYSTKF